MESNQTPISELLGISMEKVKEMADINAIIGDPMRLDDGTTVIPISKVSYGFASGGSDLPSKSDKKLFGGGAGAGISIKPVCFLVVSNGNAKVVSVDSGNDPVSSLISSIPEAFDKISGIIKKKKDGGDDSVSDDNIEDITV